MRPMYHLAVSAAFFIGACSVSRPASDEVKLIRELEKSLVLPVKSEPLRKYDRTYAVGPRHIKGILLINGAQQGKVSIVPENHLYMERMDGGCGAIQVVYDRVQRRWTRIVCNGSA